MHQLFRPISLVLIALGTFWIMYNRIMGKSFYIYQAIFLILTAIGLLVYSYKKQPKDRQ